MSKLFFELAPKFWAKGLCVLPLEPGAKRPASEITGWQGYCNGPPSDTKRSDWLSRYADRNIGLLTGTTIGNGEVLAAIDIDQNEFVAVAAAILGSGGVSKVGKKGRTDFMRFAKEVRSTKIHDSDKVGVIDILIGGKMTVIPPSIHPDTLKPYRWLGTDLLNADLSSLPVLDERKLALLKFVIRSPHARVLVGGETTHDAGLALSGALVRFGCDDQEVTSIITALLPPSYAGNSREELPGWIRSAREKGFDAGGGLGQARKPSPSDLLVAHLETRKVQLSHDALKRAYISVPLETGGSVTFNLASGPATEFLSHAYYQATRKAMKESTLKEAIALLKSKAIFDGPKEVVHTRVARHGQMVIIDRGTPDGSVVEITPDGFHVTRVSPVKFVRSGGGLALPEPSLEPNVTETLARVRALLGLSQQNFVLLLAFLLNCLRGEGPYMCLLVEGEQGSGKSFLCTVLRLVIDPNLAEKVRLPDNERDLMILANEQFLLVFDNSSGMHGNISDLLCSLSTGGGYVTRQLYTDGGLHVMKAVRPFIINGISDIASRPDLLERAIPVQLERMPDDDRKTETEMLRAFEALLPDFLGALYTIVACALRNEPETPTPRNIRMADVGLWLQAAEPATGMRQGIMLEMLGASQGDRIVERTNNEPVVVALREFLKPGPFQGTVGALLKGITPSDRTPKFFPQTPLKLSKDLERLKTGMVLAGVYFEKLGRTNEGQQVRAWLEGQEGMEPHERTNMFPSY